MVSNLSKPFKGAAAWEGQPGGCWSLTWRQAGHRDPSVPALQGSALCFTPSSPWGWAGSQLGLWGDAGVCGELCQGCGWVSGQGAVKGSAPQTLCPTALFPSWLGQDSCALAQLQSHAWHSHPPSSLCLCFLCWRHLCFSRTLSQLRSCQTSQSFREAVPIA